MISHKYTSLSKGDFLFKQGDLGKRFYFVVSGALEVIVKSEGSDEFKYSKTIDVNTYFGLKSNPAESRGDNARVTSEGTCEIIEFDSQIYIDIVSKTQLSTCEQKIEFLIRYVPKLRSLPRRLIEDFEVYFQKESVS
jgi:CRP-like cAMP-binding protein